jgi:DNA-binding MarR family transcriptional regulator
MDALRSDTDDARDRRDAYRLEEQVGFLLRKAHQVATEIFQSEIGTVDITPQQFSALIVLQDRGEIAQNALGDATAMDPATIAGVVQRLARRGLVAIRTDPGDGRRRLIQLTRTGDDLAGRLRAVGLRISARTLEPLSAAERRTLSDLLGRLTEARSGTSPEGAERSQRP